MNEIKNSYAVSAEKPEMVDHPAHYQGKHECIEVMRALFGDKAVEKYHADERPQTRVRLEVSGND